MTTTLDAITHRSFSTTRQAVRAAARTLAILTVVALVGCSGSEPLSPGPVDASPPVQATSASSDDVAFVLDGREVTVAEVDEHMKNQFMKEFAQQADARQFALRENAARDLVQSMVIEAEARKRGISDEAVLEEIANSVTPPTDAEISTWYQQNQSRLRGARLEDVSSQIEKLLTDERRGQALSEFMEPKLEAMSWRMVMSPPRKDLAATRLVRGAAEAPITITTFSDYQCPYCVLAEPVLNQILARYPEQVRVVHRHFPLDSIHPFARPAAEASMCAEAQGKFWEFHDAIFELSGKLVEGSLARIGADLGLDVEKLNKCIEERRYKDFVEADFAAGRAAGVTGTPAFFINGIVFNGNRDVDGMSREIDRELDRIAGS